MYHTNITEFLDEAAVIDANQTAFVNNGFRISFEELRRRVLALGLKINAAISSIRQQIAVYLPKADAIVADLAVLYSANAFMNLDISSPSQRNLKIIQSTSPSLILTNKELTEKAKEFCNNIPIIIIDDIDQNLSKEQQDTVLRLRDLSLDMDLMCIINTSGSTGTPKGVAITHRGFLDMVYSAKKARILTDNKEVIASLSPYIFDIFVFELCLMLIYRSTIVIISEKHAAFPIKILKTMKEENVSWIFWVPSIMVNIARLNLFSEISLPCLKTVWFAGEVFPTPMLNYWRKFLPNTQFVNLYGPVEISLDCTYFKLERNLDDSEPIPIGFPFPNKEIILVDDDGQVVEKDGIGEICVRGIGLAKGYFANKEKTDSVFIQDPRQDKYPDIIYKTGDIGKYNENGELMFLGRRDSIIKHHGYRIELSEIESLIYATGLVDNCCVLYNSEAKQILLVYSSNHECSNDIRDELKKSLAKWMLPNRIIYRRSLPLNQNGKLDRNKIAQDFIKTI